MTLQKNLVESHAWSVKTHQIESNHIKNHRHFSFWRFCSMNTTTDSVNDSVGRMVTFGCVIQSLRHTIIFWAISLENNDKKFLSDYATYKTSNRYQRKPAKDMYFGWIIWVFATVKPMKLYEWLDGRQKTSVHFKMPADKPFFQLIRAFHWIKPKSMHQKKKTTERTAKFFESDSRNHTINHTNTIWFLSNI